MDALLSSGAAPSYRPIVRNKVVSRISVRSRCASEQFSVRQHSWSASVRFQFRTARSFKTKSPNSRILCTAQNQSSKMKVGFVGIGIMGLAMVGMHAHAS